jgi:hypothetical protein
MTNITIKSQRFDKNKFNETINTNFTQLLNIPDPSYFDRDLATEEDFFWLYDKWFYVIPKMNDGTDIPNPPEFYPFNTHTYLAKTSAEYIGLNEINIEIQALLDEIAEIRKENLQLIKEATNLDTAIAINTASTLTLGVKGQNVGTSAIDNSTTYG